MRTILISFAVIALACAPDGATPPPQPVTQTVHPPAVAACSEAPYRLCPVDEGVRDPSFETFRRGLLAIVAERNAARLAAVTDPHVRTSFGDNNTGGLQSPPWDELSKVLQLGGAFQGTGTDATFWAPYAYAKWPEAIDAFQNVAATRAGVPVRDQPDINGKVIATVDWEILQIIPTRRKAPDTSKWLNVKTHGGQEGFVEKADVYSPVGYRAGFSKRSGTWLLEAFVAGD